MNVNFGQLEFILEEELCVDKETKFIWSRWIRGTGVTFLLLVRLGVEVVCKRSVGRVVLV